MSKSKAEVGLQCLQAMQVVDGDATPETNDTTIIEEAYDQIKAMLYTRHLVSWEDTAVPDEVIIPLCDLISYSRLSFFNPPADVKQLIIAGASTAVEQITEVLSMDYVSEPIPSEPL
jgi:hypothetical protein